MYVYILYKILMNDGRLAQRRRHPLSARREADTNGRRALHRLRQRRHQFAGKTEEEKIHGLTIRVKMTSLFIKVLHRVGHGK